MLVSLAADFMELNSRVDSVVASGGSPYLSPSRICKTNIVLTIQTKIGVNLKVKRAKLKYSSMNE